MNATKTTIDPVDTKTEPAAVNCDGLPNGAINVPFPVPFAAVFAAPTAALFATPFVAPSTPPLGLTM